MASRHYTARKSEMIKGAIHLGPGKMEWMLALFNSQEDRRWVQLRAETKSLGTCTMNVHLRGIERLSSEKAEERDVWRFFGTWFLTDDNWVHVTGYYSMAHKNGRFEEWPEGPNPDYLSTFGLGRAPDYEFVEGPGKFAIMCSLFDTESGRPNTVSFKTKDGKSFGPLHVYGAYPLDPESKVWHCRVVGGPEMGGIRLETTFSSRHRSGSGWPTGVVEMNLAKRT